MLATDCKGAPPFLRPVLLESFDSRASLIDALLVRYSTYGHSTHSHSASRTDALERCSCAPLLRSAYLVITPAGELVPAWHYERASPEHRATPADLGRWWALERGATRRPTPPLRLALWRGLRRVALFAHRPTRRLADRACGHGLDRRLARKPARCLARGAPSNPNPKPDSSLNPNPDANPKPKPNPKPNLNTLTLTRHAAHPVAELESLYRAGFDDA